MLYKYRQLKKKNFRYFGFQNFARTHSPTRLMSSENTYSLSKEHCNLKYSGKCLWGFLVNQFLFEYCMYVREFNIKINILFFWHNWWLCAAWMLLWLFIITCNLYNDIISIIQLWYIKFKKNKLYYKHILHYVSVDLAFRGQNPSVTILSWFREACGSEGCIIIEDLELFQRGW